MAAGARWDCLIEMCVSLQVSCTEWTLLNPAPAVKPSASALDPAKPSHTRVCLCPSVSFIQYELTVTYPLARPAPVPTMYIQSFTMGK